MATSFTMLADPDNFRPGVKYKYLETLIGVLQWGDNYIAEKIWESLIPEEGTTLGRIVKAEEPELYDCQFMDNVHIATLLHLNLVTRTSLKSKLVYVACTAKGHMVWESSVESEKARKMYGCYQKHDYTHHDDCGSGSSESLLLVGTSIEDVRNRYNKYIIGEGTSFRLDYDPTIDPDTTIVRHAGSTGGGLARSQYTTQIRELEQVG